VAARTRNTVPRFELQFPRPLISDLAARYPHESDASILDEIGPAARSRGYFTRSEFIDLCRWKTVRSQRNVRLNSAADVEEATRLALGAGSEALRIQIPMALHGVSWATSSVLLHFGHNERYPIIDYRALQALGVYGNVVYSMPLWLGYVDACRSLATTEEVDMRTLD
jgi:hypothetical protein